MYKKLIAINKNDHKNKTVKKVEDFSYAKNMISSPLGLSEVYEACKDYPIFFTKDPNDENSYVIHALLGFEENKNIFIDKDNKWLKAKHIPSFIRKYPFSFVPTQDPNSPALAIDEEYLNQSDKYEPLFKDEKNSEFLDNVLKYLSALQNDLIAANRFVKQLIDLELVEEKTAFIRKEDKSYKVGPFYIVNEEKLNHLGKKKKELLCEKNLQPLITAHLISLSNIQRLASI